MPLTARLYQTKKQDTSGSQAKWNHGYLPVEEMAIFVLRVGTP